MGRAPVPLYTTPDVARHLNVTVRQIDYATKLRDVVPSYRLGKSRVWTAKDVREIAVALESVRRDSNERRLPRLAWPLDFLGRDLDGWEMEEGIHINDVSQAWKICADAYKAERKLDEGERTRIGNLTGGKAKLDGIDKFIMLNIPPASESAPGQDPKSSE